MLSLTGPRTASSADAGRPEQYDGVPAARGPRRLSLPPGLRDHMEATPSALGRKSENWLTTARRLAGRPLGERKVEFAVLGAGQEGFPLVPVVDLRCLVTVL